MSAPSAPGTVPGTVATVCARPYVVGRGTLSAARLVPRSTSGTVGEVTL